MTDEPRVEDWMKILAELTSWSDQSLSVKIGYKRRCDRIAQDETRIVDDDWGFTVETTICGEEGTIGAQGETLEDALDDLATKIVRHLDDVARNLQTKALKAFDQLTEHNMSYLREHLKHKPMK